MENRLDLLAKALAGSGMSRRDALRKLGGTAAATVLASFGIGCADDVVGPSVPTVSGPRLDIGRCKKDGWHCRENEECCSNFCDPRTAMCSCSAGSNLCPSTGICVRCQSDQAFNPVTCECKCIQPGDEMCGTVCCPTIISGIKCCNDRCANTNFDQFNCGACGRVCAANEFCSFGMCVPFA